MTQEKGYDTSRFDKELERKHRQTLDMKIGTKKSLILGKDNRD